jgi:hypothetical protein
MPKKMRLALVGAAIAVATSGVTVLTAGVATASGPAVTIPSGPFSDGQSITVSGSGFPTRSQAPSGLSIIQCSDPGGNPNNLPTDAGGCDGSTVNPLPIYTDSFGNFTASYTVSKLTTSTGSNINCTFTNACALWVGVDYNSDFSGNRAFSSSFIMKQVPFFTSANSVTFHEGSNGAFAIAASGLPVPAITESGALPGGVSFTPGNGSATLSGAPNGGTAASYVVTMTGTNSEGTTNQTFTLTVTPASTFGIAAAIPPVATRGSSYMFQLSAVGPSKAPLKWKTSGKLPKGLKINHSTGLISGTPSTSKHSKPGNYSFTAGVQDHSKPKNKATQNFTITLQ